MNLDKLFQAQKELREHINYNGEDRFEKLVLALLVEIGECANEWRGFKFWSKNQEPSKPFYTTAGVTNENAVGFSCGECGDFTAKGHPWFEIIMNDRSHDCKHCGAPEMFIMREKNPLLEEYVDGLHFVLELGIELKSEIELWELEKSKKEDITTQFIYITQLITDIWDNPRQDIGWMLEYYLGLGEMLGFTEEQIEQAYFAKNQINHSRQENGY